MIITTNLKIHGTELDMERPTSAWDEMTADLVKVVTKALISRKPNRKVAIRMYNGEATIHEWVDGMERVITLKHKLFLTILNNNYDYSNKI